MASDLRVKIHEAVEQLPQTQLEVVLRFVELLMVTPARNDIEPEEMWLLASGALKRMVDEIEAAPVPIEDWRSHLHDL
jgi:hypothetical protein